MWSVAGGGEACSGFLVEHDGFRHVLDLGYATVPRLLGLVGAEQVGISPVVPIDLAKQWVELNPGVLPTIEPEPRPPAFCFSQASSWA